MDARIKYVQELNDHKRFTKYGKKIFKISTFKFIRVNLIFLNFCDSISH